MATRYYISLPNPALARGSDATLAFSAHGAEEFAAQLQDALRTTSLFERWRKRQDDPDGVDPSYGAVDPDASVHGQQDDLHVMLVVTSVIPGSGWELRDVTAA